MHRSLGMCAISSDDNNKAANYALRINLSAYFNILNDV